MTGIHGQAGAIKVGPVLLFCIQVNLTIPCGIADRIPYQKYVLEPHYKAFGLLSRVLTRKKWRYLSLVFTASYGSQYPLKAVNTEPIRSPIYSVAFRL
ncbi:MAG: hypothetical protein KME10_24610 [Plectolyngbya sp. WJT66-NPBG17]|nr:hypothetical protein [Plectolyngbya sp. WJT66-NPBG17]